MLDRYAGPIARRGIGRWHCTLASEAASASQTPLAHGDRRGGARDRDP